MQLKYYDGRVVDRSTGCSAGQTCIKSTKWSSDGTYQCTDITADDGIVSVCDGECR